MALAGATLLLYVLFAYTELGNVMIHGVVNIFAGGRSTVKVVLFLIYVLVLGLVSLPYIAKQLQKYKIRAEWLLTSFITAFAYNLILLIAYFRKIGVSISDFVITFNNGEISSTALLHSHILKGFNGLLLKFFGYQVQENIDTGWAFIGLIPNFWFWLGGILGLACLILSIIKFSELFHEQKNRPWVFFVLYAVTTFTLLKNLIDGGVFNREAPIALSALMFILLSSKFITKKIPKNEKLALSLLPIIIYAALTAVIYFYFSQMSNDHVLNLYMSATLIVILLTLIYWYKSGDNKRLGVLLIILSITFAYVPLAQNFNGYLNSLQKLPSDGAFVGLYNLPAKTPHIKWDKIESINNLSIYNAYPDGQVPLKKLISDNALLSNLGPVNVPWVNCFPTYPDETISFDLITPTELPLTLTPNRMATIKQLNLIGQNSGLYRYQIKFAIKRCTPRVINVVEEYFKLQGQKTFFVINLSGKNGFNF